MKGYLDILLVVKEDKKTENNQAVYKLIALKNEYYDDVYFLKVMVIPGKCAVSRCPFGSLVSLLTMNQDNLSIRLINL